MSQFNSFDEKRHTAIYVRISTASQKTDRKPSNLLKDLEWFQSHDCLAYFHKQNLWVGDKSDIGTQIMIQVLAVMSQYEIELFTSRGIDGKISAIKNRKTTCGGFSPYGYRISEDSRLVINEDEAAVVRRIFSMYLHGEKTVNKKDTLNSEKIPCPYKARQDETTLALPPILSGMPEILRSIATTSIRLCQKKCTKAGIR